MTTEVQTSQAAVRKSVTVKAPAERAFRVFTEGIDTWWPRSHHIGKAPMKKTIIEGRVGGRCYSEQVDDTQCDWGSIIVWDPPHRLVIAWQINSNWQYESDLSKSSEVEVRFTSEPNGFTRVDLEHRHFERLGPGADAMRTAVDHPDGWTGLLQHFANRIAQSANNEPGAKDQ
jgi:uncharacterized protein YndB with AHSA1/START domain